MIKSLLKTKIQKRLKRIYYLDLILSRHDNKIVSFFITFCLYLVRARITKNIQVIIKPMTSIIFQ